MARPRNDKPAALDWVSVSVDLPRHPKSLLLASIINEPKAYAYLIEAWAYCVNHARHGRIEKRLQPILARLIGWTGVPEALWNATTEAGFTEWDGDELVFHNWERRQGRVVLSAIADIERKRKGSDSGDEEIGEGFRRSSGGVPARGNSPETLVSGGVSGGVPAEFRRVDADADADGVKTPKPPFGNCDTEAVTIPDLQLHRAALKQPASPAVQAHADGPALCERMDSVFRELRGVDYSRVRNDDLALGNLAKHGDVEVLRRWRIALTWRGYPSCSTWVELAKGWNAYAKAQDATAGPGRSAGDRPRI